MLTAQAIDRQQARHGRRVNLLLLALLVGGVLLSLKQGVISLTWSDLVRAACGTAGPDVTMLLAQLRLPRIVMAVLVGVGLSTAGTLLQGVTRNDLATPEFLGVMGGGSLAVTIAMCLMGGMIGPLVLPLASLAGAALTVALVFALSVDRGTLLPVRLLLTGMAVSTAASALTSVLFLLLPMSSFDFLTTWLSSSLARASWTNNLILLPWIAVLLPIALVQGARLTALSQGEEVAVGLGVRVNRSRCLLAGLAVALAASCVAIGGGVAFLGLLAPHIARRLVGCDYRRVIPTAALVGVVLLVVADLAGRSLFGSNELPAGVLVTALGGPYFLYLLIRS